MSNKFNKQRGTLPRPKVCKTPPVPDVPPVLPTCSLLPVTAQGIGGQLLDFTIFAVNPSLPIPGQIGLAYETTAGVFTGPATMQQEATEPCTIELDFDVGFHEAKVTFTFADFSTCESIADVEIIPI